MSDSWLARTELLLGEEGLKRLKAAHILVVGLGGVGAYAAEQLCRAGVGEMTIVDGDCVEESNRNRQLIALGSTLGRDKVSLMAERLLDINPDLKLHPIKEYIRDEAIEELLSAAHYDYVLDAIDTLSPKTFFIYHCVKAGLRVASSMGSGGKCDPQSVRIADISKSHGCALARMLRKRLHRLGIREGVKVVFSSEAVPQSSVVEEEGTNKKSVVGTISYMPPIFGCFLASIAIRDIVSATD